MNAKEVHREPERVLLAGPDTTLSLRATVRIVAAGGEAIVVASAAEARSAGGPFDRALFAFDLPDGSGIVLAAEMMLEDRVRYIGFVHPHEAQATQDHDARNGTPSAESPTSATEAVTPLAKDSLEA